MTLCIGWIRKLQKKEEICLASDSCFSGGQHFLAAPKVFPLPRKDCAIACAGDTSYSLPIVTHLTHAVEINKPLLDRAYDFLDMIHLVEDITNQCLLEEKDVQINENEGPNFTMILAGYSYQEKQSRLYIISYDKSLKKMKANKAPTIMGTQVAVIGDHELISKVKRKIYLAFERDGKKRGDSFDYQPLDVLNEYINNPAITSVDGHLQMLKIYPFAQVLPIGFYYPNEKRIFYNGRPLLTYETFPFPIFDTEKKIFKYMKVNSDDFELVHEKTRPLTKFKGRRIKE